MTRRCWSCRRPPGPGDADCPRYAGSTIPRDVIQCRERRISLLEAENADLITAIDALFSDVRGPRVETGVAA